MRNLAAAKAKLIELESVLVSITNRLYAITSDIRSQRCEQSEKESAHHLFVTEVDMEAASDFLQYVKEKTAEVSDVVNNLIDSQGGEKQ